MIRISLVVRFLGIFAINVCAAVFAGDSTVLLTINIRPADRCLALSWPVSKEQVRWHLFRSENEQGPFAEISGSPFQTQTIADVNVVNGRRYFYRLAPDGDKARESFVSAVPHAFRTDDEFLDFLEITAFDYFWNESDPETGLIRDRSTPTSPCSIAAVGFGLTAIGIGVDHGWVTRDAGAERTARTLRTFTHAPPGPGPGMASYKGWFYHFLEMRTALRYRQCELSSIDTALLLAGVLYAREFFDRDTTVEREIRILAQQLEQRVDWNWMLNHGDTLSMGWHPESGFIKSRWSGYNEASILLLLGLGSTTPAPLEPKHWNAWTSTYEWRTSYGYSFIHFAPLFGHQYTACWVDYRQIQDAYTRAKELTYFENSRRATLAQRAYALENPKHFPGYGAKLWGFTACDGPNAHGITGYAARGTPPPELDDGTIAPTAAGASLPFAPQECTATLRSMYSSYREKILCGYGFRDAFNLSVNWWDPDVLGIDQGPILLMIENLRGGKVWQVMRRSDVLRRGLERAGFRDRLAFERKGL